MAEKQVLVAAAVVFRKEKGGEEWFVVKNEEGDWELPKEMVRKGESSVRAAIRAMAELGGMSAKVLEEAGRSGGAAKLKGKLVTQRYLYYLMQFKDGGEVLGYPEYEWLDYARAVRRLVAKRDKLMLRQARSMRQQIEKDREAKLKKKNEVG